MTEWVKASGQNETNIKVKEIYNKMPKLSSQQFSSFYKYINNNNTKESIDYYTSTESDEPKKQVEIVKKINYDLPNNIKEVGWLAFWVYMCNKAQL